MDGEDWFDPPDAELERIADSLREGRMTIADVPAALVALGCPEHIAASTATTLAGIMFMGAMAGNEDAATVLSNAARDHDPA